MTRRLLRSRMPYLDRLGAAPLFADVPRHLLPVLGRALEVVDLPGASQTACRRGDVLVVQGGHGVVTRDCVPTMALRSGAVIDTAAVGGPTERIAVIATAALRGWLVPRGDVAAIRRIAPALDRALADGWAWRKDPDREPSSVSRSG